MPLRPYQQESVDNTIIFLKENKGNPVIAIPTGGGKSHIIAGTIERLILENLFVRILKLVHTKELIVQNKEKLQALLPSCDLGILSSGLKSHQTTNQIIFGGIATVVTRARQIGHIDYVIIDEVHMCSDNEKSIYQKTFTILKEVNPLIKFIGLTASPYRVGKGSIIDGKMWHGFSINLTSFAEFNKLITDNYLCNLISRLPDNVINTSDVTIQKGEFNQQELQQAVYKNDVTHKAIKEAIIRGANCNKWLVFCSGVEHANDCNSLLNHYGIPSTVVHSDMSTEQRDSSINGFKEGRYKAICNNNILTVGFDCPEIDLIIGLRPTMSVVLFVQMMGRGLRPHISKPNGCLVLDFAYNVQRHGCINDVQLPKKKGTKAGETPVKLCPACQVYNHLSARVCIACGVEFVIKQNIKRFASADELIRTEENIPRWVDVLRVYYKIVGKEERAMLMPFYYCKGVKLKEFIHFGGTSLANKQKSINWWWKRMNMVNHKGVFPDSATIAFTECHKIKTPSRIEFEIFKGKPKILKYEFTVNGERKVIE